MPVIQPSTFTFANSPVASFVQEFGQDRSVYMVDDAIAPPFEVPSKAGAFGKFEPESLMQAPRVERASGGHYNVLDTKAKQDTWKCEDYGLEKVIDDSDQALYASAFDLHSAETDMVLHAVLRARSIRLAALVLASGAPTSAATAAYTSHATATPLTDATTAKNSIFSLTGRVANLAVMSYNRFLHMGQCAEIVDRIKAVDPSVKRGELSEDQLAIALGVEKVIAHKVLKNSAKDGQTASATHVWDSTKVLYAAVGGADPRQPQFARTMVWNADGGQMTAEVYRDDKRRSDVARCFQLCQEKILVANAGYILTGC